MIRVLIADDHPVVRKGTRQILEDALDVADVIDEACTGEEVLEKALKEDYSIILLDITMPGRSGFDILRELRSRKPEIPVLILSVHPEEQYAVRMLKMGASGYLTKELAPEELVAAIRRVLAGSKYVGSSLAERLIHDLIDGVEKLPHESLSDREYQVMCRIASGKAVNEIAKELVLSVKTISTYRSRILEKMRMNNNSEIVRYVLERM